MIFKTTHEILFISRVWHLDPENEIIWKNEIM